MSQVIFLKVPHVRNGVQDTTHKTMELLDWEKHIKGRKVFVKVNLISSEFVPGQCTSPLVLDAVLSALTERGYRVTFGDADLAAAHQCNRAAEVWGHKLLARKYGAKFINLSEDKLIPTEVNGKIFKTLDIPKSILDCDSVITLPVMKTHCLTEITCCLKHFWGVVPRVRHQFHLVVDEAIADINEYLHPKVAFAIVDGTVAMEGNGPRTGISKICDVIMGSTDLVACDHAVARYTGLLHVPKHIVCASERKIGSLDFEIAGDIEEYHKYSDFVLPKPGEQPIFKWEMFFRRTPLKPLLFDTPIFNILSWIATKYNTIWYYQLHGKGYKRNILESTWYGKEFLEYIPELK